MPAFNEERGIRAVVGELREIARTVNYPFEIIIVDDGSTDRTPAEIEAARKDDGVNLRVIRNDQNRGYGYSLKRGIRESSHQIIVITDGDGTYPNSKIPELVQKVIAGAAMAVGARSLLSSSVPLSRKPAKWMLNMLANFLAGRRVPDYNSGLRAMRYDLVEQFEPILPDGFSFTTTIMLSALTNGYQVDFVPIEYAVRKGVSKIRPIRDTANFFNLIVRTVLYFRPLKVFIPLAGIFYFSALSSMVRDHWQKYTEKNAFEPVLGDVTLLLFLAGLNLLVVGFLADLACEAFRPPSLQKTRSSRVFLYENPLGSLTLIAFVFLFIAFGLHFWDKVIHDRTLRLKTLTTYVTALQMMSAGLLADLLKRRGRLR
ncbi:MAG: glycosyltransferase family 2 protein [Planctomycetes bacterium]|nr:glycosyltransferase family 2 protein [Planctomycetota bacterium]